MTEGPPDASLAINRHRYLSLVRLAKATKSQDADARLAYIGSAADSAWHSHPGFFTDRELEGLARLPKQPQRYAPSATVSLRERVLHVFTQAYAIGGHTRLAERWMWLDSEREHSAAITWQAADPIPQTLTDVVESRGGRIYYLDRRPGRLSSRAARLRSLAASFDYVIIHAHPSDPVPLAAFQTTRSSPVILLNHADHVFWLGAAIADLYVSVRESGRALCVTRRGIPESQCTVLPVPVPPARFGNAPNAVAKQHLDIPSGAFVLLTVASGYKFAETPEPSFARVHTDILTRNPDFYHIVVGVPPEAEQWTRAALMTAGRLRAVAATNDLNDYWAAADAYADSFPFASLTSVLEAMSHGIPCVSFDPFDGASPILRLGDAGNLALYFEGSDLDSYEAAITELSEDTAKRASAGIHGFEVVRSRHWGSRWRAQLESVYASSLELATRPPISSIESQTIGESTVTDDNLAIFHAKHVPSGPSSRRVPARFFSVLPAREAVRVVGNRPNWREVARILIPDWTTFAIGSVTGARRNRVHTRAD